MFEQEPRPSTQIEAELDDLLQAIRPEASFARRLRGELLAKAENMTRKVPSPGRVRWQHGGYRTAVQWGLGLAGLALLVGVLVFSIGLLPETPLSPAGTPSVQAVSPVTGEAPTTVPTLASSPRASAVKTQPTLTPATTATPAAEAGVGRIASPDGRWTAILDRNAGSLDVVDPQGGHALLFSPGSTAGAASWSPDGKQLVIVLGNWPEKAPDAGTKGVPEIWLAAVQGDTIGAPVLLYRPQEATGTTPASPQQILLGSWSPDSQRLLFWQGMLSASIVADGLPLWSLEVPGGQATPLSQAALVNPAYQSWAPDGSALAFTDGGYRSAQVGKWLARYDASSGQVSTLIPQDEQVPGALAWSPLDGQIAYAAVAAGQTSPDLADWMSWDNSAILARRVYLLDAQSGAYQRLNQLNAYQDAPRWNADGKTLYYVQMDGDQAQIMAADPASGKAAALAGCRAPLPDTAGYYGQVDWSSLYAACPQAGGSAAPTPAGAAPGSSLTPAP
jgi:Tol biopolymer transport system component